MRMKFDGKVYRSRLEIMVATELTGKYSRMPVHTCRIDGFRGTRKEMLWHIKLQHRDMLEVVE
jgi:hypothetical protein